MIEHLTGPKSYPLYASLDITVLAMLAVLICTSTLALILHTWSSSSLPSLLTLNLALIELRTHTHTQLYVTVAFTSGGRKLTHYAQDTNIQTCKA